MSLLKMVNGNAYVCFDNAIKFWQNLGADGSCISVRHLQGAKIEFACGTFKAQLQKHYINGGTFFLEHEVKEKLKDIGDFTKFENQVKASALEMHRQNLKAALAKRMQMVRFMETYVQSIIPEATRVKVKATKNGLKEIKLWIKKTIIIDAYKDIKLEDILANGEFFAADLTERVKQCQK